MPRPRLRLLAGGGLILALATFTLAVPSQAGTEEAAFLQESAVAMMRMHMAMEPRPSGDVDADFATMMIPHHQGAIEMARAELRYGHNEQLRRIAQEIIVDQQQEIAVMQLAVADGRVAQHGVADAAPPSPQHAQHGAR